MTRTRRVTSRGWGRGTTRAFWPASARTRATSSMFWASSRKSSSSTMVSANSSTRAGGLARAATGMRPTSSGASQLMAARSRPDHLGHGGALHLDDHPLAGEQAGRVDLGDGGGGQGHGIDRGEQRVEGPAEVLLDDPADHGEGLGRDPVAQQPELVDQLLGEEPFARGEDLAQLDVGGSQPLEGPAQPARQSGSRLGPGPPARSTRAQPATAVPRTVATRTTRTPGGQTPAAGEGRGLGPLGWPAGRRCRRVQDRSSGSTSQGGCDEKAPTARSDGSGSAGSGRTVRSRWMVRRWGPAHSSTGPMTRVPLWPPKPKEFDSDGRRLPGPGRRRGRRRGRSRGRARS